MTYFHYYATTSRNLDRVLQYAVYPIAQATGMAIFRNSGRRDQAASDFARIVSAGIYSLLTTAFLGFESEMIDQNARKAVAAELGIEPEKLKFSDYKYSHNSIISNAHRDIMRLQKYRYGTDFLFVLPTAIREVSKHGFGKEWPDSHEIAQHPENHSSTDLLLNWHNGWNMSVYAGKALYWAGETYAVQKSSHYEVMKLRENLESTGKDLSANDLLAVYQRARNDRKMPMIETKEEYDAVRPLLTKMADAYDKHDGKFGMSEIVYLIGLGKINIHGPDNKTVSAEAIAASEKEIDKVLTLGLDGIRKEKKALREAHGLSDSAVLHGKSFADRFGDAAVNTVQSIINGIRGKKSITPEEFITVRDPGESVNWNSSYHR